MRKNFKIITGEREILYIWVPERDNFYFDLNGRGKLKTFLYDSEGRKIKDNPPFILKNVKGIFAVEIEGEREIEIEIEENNFLFSLPGFGLVPSHFEKNHNLKFFYDKNLTLWTYIPFKLKRIILQTTLFKDFSLQILTPSEKREKPLWLTCPLSPYNTSILENVEKGWYGFDIKTENVPFRFLIYGTFPLFFEKPHFPFNYRKFYFDIRDEKGKKLDSNLKFSFLNNFTGIYNKIAADKKPLYLPPLKFSLLISSGFKYKEMNLLIKKTKQIIKMKEFLPSPEGWVCGDLHIHSCINSDGAEPPEIIAENAICNGLNFIFISDSPEIIKRCEKYNKKDKFLILPGQEIGNPYFHINALNFKEDLQKFSDEKNPEKTIEILIEKLKEKEEKGRKVSLMLNHPSHLKEIKEKYKYFDSWWIIDKYKEIKIVENFDFETWFEKLNEGKRITGLWTTDTHDSSLIPPGLKRNYVYVGEKFNEKILIERIEKGNVFCTRYPGVIIDFKINGKIPGEEIFLKKDEYLKLKIYCESRRPIKNIEIIGDGKRVLLIDGGKSFIFDREISIMPEYKWIILRVYLFEEEWRNDSHSIEPLLISGCSAFTNPIWIKTID